MAWLRAPAASRNAAAEAAASLAGTEVVLRSIQVMSVMITPPSSAREKERTPIPYSGNTLATSMAVGRSLGSAAMTMPIMIQPPSRLVTAVPAQSRASALGGAHRGATAAMGTRKFSVNSSLLARVRAMKPMGNASADSRTLFVA